MSLPPRRDILVVGPAWVGDMVMAQSLFRLLHERDPAAAIDVVAPGWSVPLVARMPEVRHAHTLPLGHGQFGFGIRRRLGVALRAQRYARAIVIPRSFKAALVPYFARIPRRTGFHGEMRYGLLNDRRTLDKTRLPTTVSRYLSLGLEDGAPLPEPLPQPCLSSDAGRAATRARELGLDLPAQVVALFPGAEYGPAKQWPASRFAELARRLADDGVATWLFGSAKEHALGAEIASASGAENLCGRTELVDVVDLLRHVQVAVSNDSGLMHVAAAAGVAVVAIYGSSSPAFTPPLTRRASVVQEPQPCSPCFARTCRYGHYDCLTRVDATRVLSQVQAWLSDSSAPAGP